MSKNPSLVEGLEAVETDAEGVGMIASDILEETSKPPEGELVVFVADESGEGDGFGVQYGVGV